jgi:hypothetical protein
MAAIYNASLVLTHLMHPPGFGYESIFHFPQPPANPTPGTHTQHVLRVEGSVPHAFADYYLKVDALIRGALWRTQTHHLCTALQHDPELEHRRCQSNGTGAFSASVWSFIPSSRPGAPLRPEQQSPALSVMNVPEDDMATRQTGLLWPHERQMLQARSTTHAERLRIASAVLSRLDVCTMALPAALLAPACNASANATETRRPKVRAGKLSRLDKRHSNVTSPDQLMRSSSVWHGVAHSDFFSADWRSVGTMFVLAALTLPHPFAIVESGNFCGGVTGYFAILKRALCPSCQYLSLDPGGYRRKRHVKFTCNRLSLEWLGLSEHVRFVDEPSPALELEQPVGFVYYDGGKVRFCNAPLQAYLEDKSMVGALIGLDDVWQAGAMPHAVGQHHGQIMFVHEMVQSGDWTPLLLPAASKSGGVRAALYEDVVREMQRYGAAPDTLSSTAALFPENSKQALLVKRRSRFGAGAAGAAEDVLDGLRIALVQRGGPELAVHWIPLPSATS